jgi:hypothetical protein
MVKLLFVNFIREFSNLKGSLARTCFQKLLNNPSLASNLRCVNLKQKNP